MRLTPPSMVVFLISFILAVAVVATKYFGVTVPVVQGNLFGALLFSYVLLVLGTLVRGM